MRLTRTTWWVAGTSVLCVLMMVAAWFLLVAPQRADARASREATAGVESSNAQLERRIAELRAEFARLPAREAELLALRSALPDTAALSSLLAQVSAAATGSGVVLDSVTAGQATSLIDSATAAAAEPAAADGDGEPGGGDGGSESPSDTTEEAAGAAPGGAPPVGAAPGGAGVTAPTPDGAAETPDGAGATGPLLAAIPVTITATGDFAPVASFVDTVQGDILRAVLVDTLSVATASETDAAEGAAAGTVTATMTGRVFVFTDPAAWEVDGLTGSSTSGPTSGPTGDPTASEPTTGTDIGDPAAVLPSSPATSAPGGDQDGGGQGDSGELPTGEDTLVPPVGADEPMAQ